MTRPVVLWPTLILIGTFLTLVTVLIGNWIGGYGFPLAWKTGGCPHLASQSPHRACSLSLMTGWASDLTFYSTQLLGIGCSSPTPSTVLEEKRLRGATVTGCLKEIPIKAGPTRGGLYQESQEARRVNSGTA